MSGFWERQLSGPTDPARDAAWVDPPARKGFFTDTSICIGCKACEVACKEWNRLPMDSGGFTGDSYDNTGHLGADTWRHVAFVEQSRDRIEGARATGRALVDLGMPTLPPAPMHGLPRLLPLPPGQRGDGPAAPTPPAEAHPTGRPPLTPEELSEAELAAQAALAAGTVPDFRWLIASDVCKHCTHAGCLDVCPTGALFRTQFGTVVVQDDVCNGCGYCVAACPFGVIERRERPHLGMVDTLRALLPGRGDDLRDDGLPDHTAPVKLGGIAQKCTLCYDRLSIGATPACAQACPTTSIQFGDLDEMRRRAHERVATLHANGHVEARSYGADPSDGVGGTGSVFLLLDSPEVYGLPPDPVVPTRDLPAMFRTAGVAGLTMLAAAAISFATSGRRER